MCLEPISPNCLQVFKAVVSFVAKLLECFGQFAVTASGGYGRPINTNVAVNFGVSGASDSSDSIKILQPDILVLIKGRLSRSSCQPPFDISL